MQASCGMDYVRAAFKRDFANRVPVTVSMGNFQANLAGMSLETFLTDPKQMVAATLQAYDKIRPDTMVAHIDLNLETEPLGNQLEFQADGPPLVRKKVLEDDKGVLAKLKVPEPETDGRGPFYLQACKELSAHFGREVPVASVVNGPWNIAVTLRGAERLIEDTFDDPPFVQELMQYTTEVAKAYTVKLKETGTGVSMTEAAASCSLISPQLYRTFIKPYHMELFEFYKANKINVSLHICGFIDPILEDVLELRINALSVDNLTSMKRLRDLAGTRIVAIGNIDPKLYAQGSSGQIEQAVREVVDLCAPDSAFILSSGCEIPYDSTLDRVRHFIEFGREYGKYVKE
ncbi:MAG: uroporphyrinogen decarboxylase family protein [Desulfobacterales bacterium]|nr:MAG: uroporphyrinogen decarboxylase family protein [Desulfobacterales bacterium]